MRGVLSNFESLRNGSYHQTMPHTHTRHGSSGDDLGSTDEVKIFKDEGDHEDEKISSENLLVEEKSSLIDLTESEVSAQNNYKQKSLHFMIFDKYNI